MKKNFKPEKKELNNIFTFIHNNNEKYIDNRTMMKIDLATEEIFVNIVNYAYKDRIKEEITIEIKNKDNKIIIIFEDTGIPFNPLDKEDPDINLSIEEREAGGLGIFMTKKMMDNVAYEYKNGKNILTIEKNM